MEERRSLLLKRANNKERGYQSSAKVHQQRAQEMELHIDNQKQILFMATQVD